jgi:hypothetical protein
MSNRRFEMYQYRQIIVRLRLGESIRSIAKAGLAGRRKVKNIYRIAKTQGWLDIQTSLPDESLLATYFSDSEIKAKQESSAKVYEEQIINWTKQGIKTKAIHAALQQRYNFTGSYYAVRRLLLKHELKMPSVTIPLDLNPVSVHKLILVVVQN